MEGARAVTQPFVCDAGDASSRIGKQQYKGSVDREAFRAFYEACERPLVYNGDLLTVADIREVLEAFPRLKGVMLGRGLLANPALALAFREGELSESELKARVAQMHWQMYLYYHRVIEGGEAQPAGQAEDLLGVPVAGAGQETAEGYLEEQSPGRVSAGSGRGVAGINHPSFFLKYSYPMRQNRHFLVSQ